MNKKILISLFLIAAGLVGIVFLKQLQTSSSPSTKNQVTQKTPALKVEATFYPLADFAKHIGGDLVSVTTLIPAGAEPHDFEPSTQDIARMYQSQIYIYNGAGLEGGWLNKILPELQQNHVLAVKASEGVQLLSVDPSMAEGSSTVDPHVWLDPVLAQGEVKQIESSFIQADPQNTAQYQLKSQAYLQKLQQLDQDFKLGLAHCQQNTIVTSHAAFGYLAKQYSLQVIAIAGLSPDEEPSPQRLAEIVQQVRAQHIKYIFFESLVKPTLSNTIATETGAQTLVFNPLEGLTQADIDAGKDYISVQEQNLQNLRLALSCQ